MLDDCVVSCQIFNLIFSFQRVEVPSKFNSLHQQNEYRDSEIFTEDSTEKGL